MLTLLRMEEVKKYTLPNTKLTPWTTENVSQAAANLIYFLSRLSTQIST